VVVVEEFSGLLDCITKTLVVIVGDRKIFSERAFLAFSA